MRISSSTSFRRRRANTTIWSVSGGKPRWLKYQPLEAFRYLESLSLLRRKGQRSSCERTGCGLHGALGEVRAQQNGGSSGGSYGSLDETCRSQEDFAR